jgi:hypothetical protein
MPLPPNTLAIQPSYALSALAHSSLFEILARLSVEKRNGQRIVSRIEGLVESLIGCLTLDLGGYAEERKKRQVPHIARQRQLIRATTMRQEMATLLLAVLSRGNPEAQSFVDKGVLRILSRLIRAAETPRPSADCELDIGDAGPIAKAYAQLTIGYLAMRKNRRTAPSRENQQEVMHGNGSDVRWRVPPPCIPPALLKAKHSQGRLSKFPMVPLPPPRTPYPPVTPPPQNVKYATGMEPKELSQFENRARASTRTATGLGGDSIRITENVSTFDGNSNASSSSSDSVKAPTSQQAGPEKNGNITHGNSREPDATLSPIAPTRKKQISNICSCM